MGPSNPWQGRKIAAQQSIIIKLHPDRNKWNTCKRGESRATGSQVFLMQHMKLGSMSAACLHAGMILNLPTCICRSFVSDKDSVPSRNRLTKNLSLVPISVHVTREGGINLCRIAKGDKHLPLVFGYCKEISPPTQVGHAPAPRAGLWGIHSM